MGADSCRSYLRGIVFDVKELLNRKWNVVLNYAKRPVNIVALVLAFIQKGQCDTPVIHAEPPPSQKVPYC